LDTPFGLETSSTSGEGQVEPWLQTGLGVAALGRNPILKGELRISFRRRNFSTAAVARERRAPYLNEVNYSIDRLATAARLALDLAWARTGATAPNPPVGCVLLDATGHIIASAAHERAGAAHAEAAALAICRAKGELDRVHAAVVTLEPCSHTGRTPPCVDALVATGAKLVLIGAPDPHPRAPGRGFERLKAAGLHVILFAELEHGEAHHLARSAARLIEPFACAAAGRRPFVTVKTALTADGSMIPPPGQKTFTSALSLNHAHILRRRADAILTGSGCILADDPSFTVRKVPNHPEKQPILAILDRRDRVPAAYFERARARGLRPHRFQSLDAAMDDLQAWDVLEVLVEAGPTLRRAVLTQGLWDEEIIFQQAKTAGAPDATHIVRRDGAPPFLYDSPMSLEGVRCR
jgi:diaminohydroxyphosphoribosylaminopyrimidine deaminase/5-amino-6-(5-phosphoribosylamino)uracil reductase